MKKLLACGLILSTLMSFGSVCFAMGREHGYCNEFMFSVGGKKGDENKHNKSPKPSRSDKEETKAEKLRKAKQKLQDLRDQAVALLSGYYDLDCGVVWYTNLEVSRMSIGDLNDDCTILTCDGVKKALPPIVAERLRCYLALKEKLFPETMSAEQHLFTVGNISQAAQRGCEQLSSACIFTNREEVWSIMSAARDKALVCLYDFFVSQGFSGKSTVNILSELKIKAIDFYSKTLTTADGEGIAFDDEISDSISYYLRIREGLFPETMDGDCFFFINCQNPKLALPVNQYSLESAYHASKP